MNQCAIGFGEPFQDGVGGNSPVNQSVFATLFCEAAAPFVEHNTALTGVPLGPDGDFRIDDTLNPAPPSVRAPSSQGATWEGLIPIRS